MENNILYLVCELPVPIILLIVGITIWKCPPGMSENFGYRTRRADHVRKIFRHSAAVEHKLRTNFDENGKPKQMQ